MQVGLPKGHLKENVMKVLYNAGIIFEFTSDRDYRPVCNMPWIEAKMFRAAAIPQLVSLGSIDIGFCGLDLVQENNYENVIPLYDLGLNPVKLMVAVHGSRKDILDNPPQRPLMIATEYVDLASKWAFTRGLAHITIQTFGSTEAYAPEHADIIFDCVETGTTMKANNLIIVDKILDSSTHLIANKFALRNRYTRGQIEEIIEKIRKINH